MSSPDQTKRQTEQPDAVLLPPDRRAETKNALHNLPPEMVVAIDGTSFVTRRPIGELVAQALGAVLVDTGRFYRSLTSSCLEAGIDLEDYAAVGDFCGKARLDVWVRRENGLWDEAFAFVNGDLFNTVELVAAHAHTSKIAFTAQARDQVSRAVRKLSNGGRFVILGRDIGARVLPATPFKFFVGGPAREVKPASTDQSADPFDFSYRHANRNNTIQMLDALFIPADTVSAMAACEGILEELPKQFARHQEKGRP